MTQLIPGTTTYENVKREILQENGVCVTKYFNAEEAVKKRIQYLKDFLKKTGRKAFVLGVSGGVDSTTAGRIAQLACEELRAEGYPAQFVAVRLPAGIQFDEKDAQDAVKFINADKILTVNIGEAATLLSVQGVQEFKSAGGVITEAQADFNKGNLKARLRMTVQYQIAAMYEGVVLGTDHNAEYVTAFYTRFGDEACDVTVLGGVNKRQIRLMAKFMGAPKNLWEKAPTADLEELNPGKLDDVGFGFSYECLDDFLEGLPVPTDIEEKIVNLYERTRFKRNPTPGFNK